jgi:hypothetical protein
MNKLHFGDDISTTARIWPSCVEGALGGDRNPAAVQHRRLIVCVDTATRGTVHVRVHWRPERREARVQPRRGARLLLGSGSPRNPTLSVVMQLDRVGVPVPVRRICAAALLDRATVDGGTAREAQGRRQDRFAAVQPARGLRPRLVLVLHVGRPISRTAWRRTFCCADTLVGNRHPAVARRRRLSIRLRGVARRGARHPGSCSWSTWARSTAARCTTRTPAILARDPRGARRPWSRCSSTAMMSRSLCDGFPPRRLWTAQQSMASRR